MGEVLQDQLHRLIKRKHVSHSHCVDQMFSHQSPISTSNLSPISSEINSLLGLENPLSSLFLLSSGHRHLLYCLSTARKSSCCSTFLRLGDGSLCQSAFPLHTPISVLPQNSSSKCFSPSYSHSLQ